MKSSSSLPFIMLIVIVLSLASLATTANVIFNSDIVRNSGAFSPIMQAQQIGDNPSQYFVCKLAVREMKWIKVLWNCNCGQRWYRWRKSWRCNYCDNIFFTQTNAVKVTYCAIENWDKQIERVFQTGNTGGRNWREVACPKGQYASKIAGRVGWEHDTDTGHVGAQIQCENINFSEKTLVQDTYGHALSELSKNKQGLFVSTVSVKYQPNGKITGMKYGFESMPVISKISVKYAKLEKLNPTFTTIETVKVFNNGSKIAQQSIGFTKSYIVKNQWTTSQSFAAGYIISEGVTINPMSIVEQTSSVSTYSAKSSSFGFNKDVITTYASSQNLIVLVPSGKVVEVSSVIQEQKVNIPFEATLTFKDRFTGEIIGERVVTGIWQGVMASTVNTVINESDIPATAEKNVIEQNVATLTP